MASEVQEDYDIEDYETPMEICKNYSSHGPHEQNETFTSAKECLDYFYEGFFEDTASKTSPILIQVRFYFLAIIIPTGILLNLISSAVFLQSRMRKLTTAYYFLALAFADNVVLIGELIRWLNTRIGRNEYITNLKFIHENAGVCKFFPFMRYFGWLLSAWLVVTICIERFIAVAYPLHLSMWSSTRKAKITICGIVLVCAGLTSPALIYIGIVTEEGYPRCTVINEHNHAHHIWLILARIIAELTVPSILVTIFTTVIIYKLTKTSQQRRLMTLSDKSENQSHQTTIALLAVAIAFVVLRAPYFISYLHYLIQYQHFDTVTSNDAQDITYILAVTNYAINFFLYMIFGRTFQKEFKRVFSWKSCKLRMANLRAKTTSDKSGSSTNDTSANTSSSGNNTQATRNLSLTSNNATTQV